MRRTSCAFSRSVLTTTRKGVTLVGGRGGQRADDLIAHSLAARSFSLDTGQTVCYHYEHTPRAVRWDPMVPRQLTLW